MVELETRPPVGGSKQRLNRTGQVDKEVAHEEEPEQRQTGRRSGLGGRGTGGLGGLGFPPRVRESTYMERMGATASTEAMRTPISQIPTVSSSPQVGSPLDFP